jgi:hypothetical protein
MQQLADELCHLGYTRLSIRVRIQALARFGCWLKKSSISLQDLTSAHTKSYEHRYGTVKNGDAKMLRMLLELVAHRPSGSSLSSSASTRSSVPANDPRTWRIARSVSYAPLCSRNVLRQSAALFAGPFELVDFQLRAERAPVACLTASSTN